MCSSDLFGVSFLFFWGKPVFFFLRQVCFCWGKLEASLRQAWGKLEASLRQVWIFWGNLMQNLNFWGNIEATLDQVCYMNRNEMICLGIICVLSIHLFMLLDHITCSCCITMLLHVSCSCCLGMPPVHVVWSCYLIVLLDSVFPNP